MMAALLPPPAIEQPAAYQLSYGVVSGTAPTGTRRVIVRVGSRKVADLPLRGHHFQLHVILSHLNVSCCHLSKGAYAETQPVT